MSFVADRPRDYYYYYYHSLNGSSGSVNGDLHFLWDRQISTPYKINTPEPINKKLAQLITSARGPPIQI